jgi:hypothetical protein
VVSIRRPPQLSLSPALDGGSKKLLSAFDVAMATKRRLRDQRDKLKARLAQTPEKEQASIRKEIENLKRSEIPRAETDLGVAARALRDFYSSRVGS